MAIIFNKPFALFFLLIICNNVFSQSTHEDSFQKGLNEYLNKNYEEALIHFNKAILFYRDNGDYYFYRAKTRIALDKHKWATEDLKKAVNINPNKAEYYSNLAYTSYIAETSNLKKNTHYLGLAKKAVELDSNSAFNHYVKGRFNFLTENYCNSVKDLTKSILLDSSFAESYYYRGKSRLKLNDNNGCKDIFYANQLGFTKAEKEAHILWKDYTTKINKIDSNFYTNPSTLVYKMDSISWFINFKNANQKVLSEYGKAIFALPINECKNKEIKILIQIDKAGNTTYLKVINENINAYLGNLIIDTIINHEKKWVPYKVNNKVESYQGVFTFGVKNVHFYEVEQLIKDEEIRIETFYSYNHVYRIPVRVVSYWVSRKVISDYQEDCENNNHYYNEGITAFQNKKYGIAISYFKKAISYNHYDLDARYNMGIAYQNKKQLEKACDCYKFCADLGDKEAEKLFLDNCKK